MTDQRGTWMLTDDGKLCMSGYPIRIDRKFYSKGCRYHVVVNDVAVSDWQTLSLAKEQAKNLAKEMDAFDTGTGEQA